MSKRVFESMSNIERRFHVGQHVHMEALRFEVESIASDLCRKRSEIVPQTEKLRLHREHRLELLLSIGYPLEPLSCSFREACKVPKICVRVNLSLGKTCILWVLIGALGDLFIEFSRDIFAL